VADPRQARLGAVAHVPVAARGAVDDRWCRQPVTGSQVSVVHGFPSSQLRDDPAVQIPTGTSRRRCTRSRRCTRCRLASAVCRHPLTGSQVSVVHGIVVVAVEPVPARQMGLAGLGAVEHVAVAARGCRFASAACWHPATGSRCPRCTVVVVAVRACRPRTRPPGRSPRRCTRRRRCTTCVGQRRVPAPGHRVADVRPCRDIVVQLRPPLAVHTPAWHVSTPLHASRRCTTCRSAAPCAGTRPPGRSCPWCRDCFVAVEAPAGRRTRRPGTSPRRCTRRRRCTTSVRQRRVLTPARASQVSVVQGLLSLQLSGVPAVQAPAGRLAPVARVAVAAAGTVRQRPCSGSRRAGRTCPRCTGCCRLQLRAAPSGADPRQARLRTVAHVPVAARRAVATPCADSPVTGSQVSVVQRLLSLQLSGVPALQAPAWHVSAPLHTSRRRTACRSRPGRSGSRWRDRSCRWCRRCCRCS